jgi:hypothetical protein
MDAARGTELGGNLNLSFQLFSLLPGGGDFGCIHTTMEIYVLNVTAAESIPRFMELPRTDTGSSDESF